MDERMRFIARLLDGESMSRLCEEFGISRKTGYKIWNRYQNTGAYALVDRSRKPHRFGNQLPEQLERTLLKLKREKPYWGAPKIRELLIRRFPNLRPQQVLEARVVAEGVTGWLCSPLFSTFPTRPHLNCPQTPVHTH